MLNTYLAFLMSLVCLHITHAQAPTLQEIDSMKSEYNEVFTNDHLNFELAYINKHLGDMEFISENRIAAAAYYEKAKAQEYDGEVIKKSEFYNSKYLLPYFQADLAYRTELVRRGASFWGLKYHKRVLSPKLFYSRLTNSYKKYTEAYGAVKELLDEWDEDNDEKQKLPLINKKQKKKQRVYTKSTENEYIKRECLNSMI